MTKNNLEATIRQRIETIAASEAVTKKELELVATELLQYVPNSGDIGTVNRLIHVLTPVNKQAAIHFFKAHLEWKFDGESNQFTEKYKGQKSLQRASKARTSFFKNNMTFWKWVEAEVKIEKKVPDYLKSIERAIVKAIKADQSKLDIMRVVVNQIDLDSVMAAASEAEAMIEAEQQKQAA